VNDFGSPSLKRFGEGEIRIIRDEYLCLSSRVMRRLFQPLVEAIKVHLSDTVLSKPRLSKLKRVLWQVLCNHSTRRKYCCPWDCDLWEKSSSREKEQLLAQLMMLSIRSLCKSILREKHCSLCYAVYLLHL